MESKEITVIDARDLMRSSKRLQVIDVRSEEEYTAVSIPNSINIPLDKITQKITEIDGRVQTILICLDGSQAPKALQLLEATGFKAQYVRGGLKDWKRIIDPSLEV